jgi:hypothetical protein
MVLPSSDSFIQLGARGCPLTFRISFLRTLPFNSLIPTSDFPLSDQNPLKSPLYHVIPFLTLFHLQMIHFISLQNHFFWPTYTSIPPPPPRPFSDVMPLPPQNPFFLPKHFHSFPNPLIPFLNPFIPSLSTFIPFLSFSFKHFRSLHSFNTPNTPRNYFHSFLDPFNTPPNTPFIH